MTFPWQFLRFLSVGILNTGVGLLVIFCAKAFGGAGDVLSNALGYSVGLTVSFLANRSWTFRSASSPIVAAQRFILAFFVAYASNLATVMFLIDALQVNSYLSQTAGILPYTLVFFCLNKYFVFRAGSVW